jgi:hypothetical protein
MDKDSQRLIAYHTHISWQAPERTIWMDDRPHPPEYAAHTWQGFSTGKWEGDTLTVTTTHLKTGWIRRNGIPRSDRAVLTEHWIRHGDYLTLASIITDPAYLTEPFIRTTNWVLDPRQQIAPIHALPSSKWTGRRGQCRIICRQQHVPRRFSEALQLPDAAPAVAPTRCIRNISKRRRPQNEPDSIMFSDAVVAVSASAQQNQNAQINVLPVQGNISMLVGATGNIAVQVGNDGILMVDTGTAQMADQVLATVNNWRNPPRASRFASSSTRTFIPITPAVTKKRARRGDDHRR